MVPTWKACAGFSLPSPLAQHADGVLQVHAADVRANLPQRYGEQVQPLEADGLIGRHQHPSPLVEPHQIFLGAHSGLGNLRPLLHPQQLLVLPPMGTEAMER